MYALRVRSTGDPRARFARRDPDAQLPLLRTSYPTDFVPEP